MTPDDWRKFEAIVNLAVEAGMNVQQLQKFISMMIIGGEVHTDSPSATVESVAQICEDFLLQRKAN